MYCEGTLGACHHLARLEVPWVGLGWVGEQSLMSSSAQLHIPYRKSKKHAKAKSTFFTFDLCSYTMNVYYENENPASEPHPFYFNHPLLLSYPCLTPILTLAFEFQNAGFKRECQTRMFNPWNEDLKLVSDTHGTKASNRPTPTYNPWNFQPHQMMTGT